MEFIPSEEFRAGKWPMYYVDVEVTITTERRDVNGKLITYKDQFPQLIVKGDEAEVHLRLRVKIDRLTKKSYTISDITLIRNMGWGVAE